MKVAEGPSSKAAHCIGSTAFSYPLWALNAFCFAWFDSAHHRPLKLFFVHEGHQGREGVLLSVYSCASRRNLKVAEGPSSKAAHCIGSTAFSYPLWALNAFCFAWFDSAHHRPLKLFFVHEGHQGREGVLLSVYSCASRRNLKVAEGPSSKAARCIGSTAFSYPLWALNAFCFAWFDSAHHRPLKLFFVHEGHQGREGVLLSVYSCASRRNLKVAEGPSSKAARCIRSTAFSYPLWALNAFCFAWFDSAHHRPLNSFFVHEGHQGREGVLLSVYSCASRRNLKVAEGPSSKAARCIGSTAFSYPLWALNAFCFAWFDSAHHRPLKLFFVHEGHQGREGVLLSVYSCASRRNLKVAEGPSSKAARCIRSTAFSYPLWALNAFCFAWFDSAHHRPLKLFFVHEGHQGREGVLLSVYSCASRRNLKVAEGPSSKAARCIRSTAFSYPLWALNAFCFAWFDSAHHRPLKLFFVREGHQGREGVLLSVYSCASRRNLKVAEGPSSKAARCIGSTAFSYPLWALNAFCFAWFDSAHHRPLKLFLSAKDTKGAKGFFLAFIRVLRGEIFFVVFVRYGGLFRLLWQAQRTTSLSGGLVDGCSFQDKTMYFNQASDFQDPVGCHKM